MAPRRFDGQIAIVTGASSGLGRRFAIDLARRGAVVTGLARRADLLDETRRQLQLSSPQSTTVVGDVGDLTGYQSMLARVEADHGRVDILVNNAGIEAPTPAGDGYSERYEEILRVNYLGVAVGTLAVLPGMRRRRAGIVVNVSSDVARAPEPREAAYAASKAAIAAFTESIAHEVASDGVFVHGVPRLGTHGDGHVGDRRPRRHATQVGAPHGGAGLDAPARTHGW